MKLIQDWPQAYKWWSVHGALVGAVMSSAYGMLPALQRFIPLWLYATVMVLMFLAIIALRVLQQTPKELPANQDGMD